MVRAAGALVVLSACLIPGCAVSDVLIATTTDPNATLGIPRHKVHVSRANPAEWWVLFGRSQGNLKMSTDAGQTWTGLDPDSLTVADWLDYHAEMAGDGEGNLYFTFPEASDNSQRFRRMEAPARTNGDFRDVVTLANLTPANWKRGSMLVADGGDAVWVFTRSSYTPVGNVRYHRSTDGGMSWYASPGDSGYVRQTGCSNVRIGSVWYGGQPAVVIWYDGQGYRYYRWDGSSWVAHADSTIWWGECTRQFSLSVISDSTFHMVWQDTDESGVLRHAWKHFSGGMGAWEYGVVDENPGNDNFLPMLTQCGGTLYAVYSRVVGGPSDRAICYKTWNGVGWSSVPAVVSTVNDNCLHPNAPPSVPDGAEHIPVVWTAGTGEPYSVMCGRIPVEPPGVGEVDSYGDERETRPSLGQGQPNPARGSCRVRYALPGPSECSIHIYNALGQSVATLLEGAAGGASGEVIWYGCDDAGGAVGPGVYFCRLRAGGASAVRKIVLLESKR